MIGQVERISDIDNIVVTAAEDGTPVYIKNLGETKLAARDSRALRSFTVATKRAVSGRYWQKANDSLSFVSSFSFGHVALTESGVAVSSSARVPFMSPYALQKR